MLKVNSEIEIKNLKTGMNKNGQAYWQTDYTYYTYPDGRQRVEGFLKITCLGPSIAKEGEKVYVHEILGVTLKKYRNKAGAWSTRFGVLCKCGKQPIKGGLNG